MLEPFKILEIWKVFDSKSKFLLTLNFKELVLFARFFKEGKMGKSKLSESGLVGLKDEQDDVR